MKAGFVSFIGRPNAGKSTLLNRIVGQKLAIVSNKPQTTRTRVVGVKNYPDGQVVFVDTPGVHKPTHRMNVRMVDVALEAMREVDVLALVVDTSVKPGPGDRYMVDAIKDVKVPVLLVLSKVDTIAKHRLLPLIDHYRHAYPFVEIVPVSGVDGTNIDTLERLFLEYLPEGEPLYPPDYLTDQTERFFVSEIVREQVLELTRDELPFSTAVVVDRFDESEATLLKLYCTILVERDSQKGIVVGKGGDMIKQIGTAARIALEAHFESRVFLDLHVKVKSEWRNDERALDEINLQNRGRQ
ncbi:MAG TPA: GTPase Era [Vicinamibacterales bacterium]|nr:GTPase Era [Vicinamibacterales bacterium]